MVVQPQHQAGRLLPRRHAGQGRDGRAAIGRVGQQQLRDGFLHVIERLLLQAAQFRHLDFLAALQAHGFVLDHAVGPLDHDGQVNAREQVADQETMHGKEQHDAAHHRHRRGRIRGQAGRDKGGHAACAARQAFEFDQAHADDDFRQPVRHFHQIRIDFHGRGRAQEQRIAGGGGRRVGPCGRWLVRGTALAIVPLVGRCGADGARGQAARDAEQKAQQHAADAKSQAPQQGRHGLVVGRQQGARHHGQQARQQDEQQDVG
ncbi:hypothetical protein D3C72_894930 [compost metagenome]